MEKMGFLDYLKKFQPGEPIKDVKGWIDAMVRFHAIQIVREIRIDGGNSILRLERYGKTLEECVNNLVLEYEEVIKSYLLDEIRPWITQYSQDHLEDDVLYLYDYFLDENGERKYPVGILPNPYDDSSMQMNPSDEEVVVLPFSSEELELLKSLDFGDEGEINGYIDDWIDSLSEKELIDLGLFDARVIANPLKDETGKKQVMDLLDAIYNKVKEAKNEVLDLMKWHENQRSVLSLAEYAEAIARVIDGEVFNEPIDGRLLEDVLSAKGKCGFSIKGNMKSRWTRIIWEIFQQGPEECQSEKWLADITRVWGLEESIKKRPYDAPLKRPDKVLDRVCEAIRNLRH